MGSGLDPAQYRADAESFCELIDREYYLHLAGLKPELEIAPIYARHAGLFSVAAVEELRRLAEEASGEERRRRRHLLHFAFDGLLGEATKEEAEESARLEAALEVKVDRREVPYRQVRVEQANEIDPARRAALEQAANAIVDERLNPLALAALERSHALCRELGWKSYADAYAELRGIDLDALARSAAGFLELTEERYPATLDPSLARAGVAPLGELRRSDLPRFFRAPALDRAFPASRLVASLAETLDGLGIDLAGQRNVRLDTESRPTKSPRAFCSTPRVPGEVYLVVSPVGGRDDFAALFHEGGHTEHYAHVDPALPFEFRHLGDNGVTESFAFLFEHLTADPEWLGAALGVDDPGAIVAHARAARLLMVRRYCAKLAYELELHGRGAARDGVRERYSELLGAAVRVRWPGETWLVDVDGGFYVACYLRAWALETRWRAALRERFGRRWFQHREAGEWLRGLWAQGQRRDAAELLAEELGEELDFKPLAAELTPA